MTTVLDDLEVYVRAAALLARPGHAIAGWAQLARRVGVSADKAERVARRLEARYGTPLVAVRNHRLALTDTGSRLLLAGLQLAEVVPPDLPADAAEIVTIEVHPAIDPAVVTAATAAYLRSELAGVRVRPLTDAARENVRTGTTAFALDLGDPGAAGDGPAVGWRLLLPPGHPAPADARAALADADRVFVPATVPDSMLPPEVRELPPARRAECDTGAAVRGLVAAGLGAGVELAFPAPPADGLTRVPWTGLSPVLIVVHQPRRASALSEPAGVLLAEFLARLTAPAADESGPS